MRVGAFGKSLSTTRVTVSAVLGAALLSASVRAEDIGYDSKADPFAALQAAQVSAAADDKLVLLVSGGDWCIWCHYLYRFLESHDDVDAALHDVFVVAKVYVGEENLNAEFFGKLPKADGAPHFWVLSDEGRVLKSQPTVVLEDGEKSYDEAAFMSFIAEWRQRER
jgi:thioredoxin-related protein